MSFIAFDLDALNAVPSVAAAGGVQPGTVSHGLLHLWAHCFRHEVDVVTEVHLKGFFGVDLVVPLEVFGFLERVDAGFRVRGADRYLRVKEAQREGGRKGRAKSTSKVGTKAGGTSGSTLRSTSGSTSGSEQALHRTPNTEHRSPNTDEDLRPLLGADHVREAPPTPAVPAEDEHSRWDVEAEAFVTWAKTLDVAFADPGPKVRDWSRAFHRKHQPKPELLRKAFMKFVGWASVSGKRPGWGLWLSDAVWEPRWAEVRAEAQLRGAA